MFLLDHTYLSNMPHSIQYVTRAEYLKESGVMDLSLDHHVIFFWLVPNCKCVKWKNKP